MEEANEVISWALLGVEVVVLVAERTLKEVEEEMVGSVE